MDWTRREEVENFAKREEAAMTFSTFLDNS
jgi:hypothetical protein